MNSMLRLVALALLVLAPSVSRSDGPPRPWAPKVVMWMEPDRSSLAMTADVLVPSRCYAAGGTVVGSPPGIRTRGDLVPIQLVVTKAAGASCPPADAVLSYRHERLAFAGKMGVVVYVVLDGRVLGEMQSLF